MKVLFAHDHKFYIYNKEYYSKGSLSKEVLARYTKVFEEVAIVSRQEEIDYKPENMSLSTGERLEFIKVPDFKSIKNYPKKAAANKIINREVKNADCVIARLPSTVGNTAIKYAKRYNKPYLVEVVGCAWDGYWNHSLVGKAIALPSFMKMKNLVKNGAYALYVTNEFLQNRYPTRGKEINCSNVSLVEFDDKVLEKRLDKISGLNKNTKLIIGTTAAIDVRFKGQQYVIEALAKLKEQGIVNYEYQLVGGGDSSYLKSIAEKYDIIEQVKILGSMPHSDVFKWLDTIDIYVQPSRQEGLPRALIEAMSRGIPAFGAKTAGIPELIEKEFIFTNTRKNIDEICDILESFNKELMLKQAKRNFNQSQNYDRELIEDRRSTFFNDFKTTVVKKLDR